MRRYWPLLTMMTWAAAFSLPAMADDRLVDGAVATLNVHVVLVTAPCTLILDGHSQQQSVSLGAIPTSRLHKPGDQSLPVAFHLLLRNCGSGSATSLPADSQHGNNLFRAPGQQAAYFTFSSVAETSGLIALNGDARGVALRIEDAQRRQIHMGQRSHRQILHRGENQLTFYAIVQQTDDRVSGGVFSAVVNFNLIYD